MDKPTLWRALNQAQDSNRLLEDRVRHLCEDNDLLRHELREVTSALSTVRAQAHRLQLAMVPLEEELLKLRGQQSA